MSKYKKFVKCYDNMKKDSSKKTEKSDYATEEVGCDGGLAGKICRHNKKKLHRFVDVYKSQHKDKIPGGKADKFDPKDFDRKQLNEGIKVELEHTNDRSTAQEIAMDHLSEDPQYYTKLKTIHVEKSLEKTVPKGVDKDKYERCIKEVKAKGSAKNEYAVCAASLKGEVNKSIDFQETKTAIDSADQHLAEAMGNKDLINQIKAAIDGDINQITFAKGVLTLSKKEPGLYNGFFQDNDGQVVEKFDSQTPELIAKNMELKNLYLANPISAEPALPHHDPVEEAEDRIIARQEAEEALETHNKLYHQGQEPGEPINGKSKVLKLKFGDFEIELKKSLKALVQDFKLGKSIDKDLLRKAVKSWKTRYDVLKDDKTAAKQLLENWNSNKEDFSQIVHGLTSMERDKNEKS